MMPVYLTADDLQDVLTDLGPAKAQWNILGLGLKLRRTELDAIKADHRSSFDCLKAMLEIWLDRVEPRPTWQAVIQALRSRLMTKMSSLADELERKHCCSSPPQATGVHSTRGDRELSDSDAYEVSNYLALLKEADIYALGLALGLDNKTLLPFRKQPTFLEDMITRWLQGRDRVLENGGHTWNSLVRGLRAPRVKQNEIADTIEDAECN